MYLKHLLQQVSIEMTNRKRMLIYFFKDDQSLPIFALYSSVNVFLMTLQGFFCSLLYCFLNAEVKFNMVLFCFIFTYLMKVREVLSRRFQGTQFWYFCIRYLRKKDQFRNRTNGNENLVRLDLNVQNSASPVSFISKNKVILFIYFYIEENFNEIRRTSLNM